MNPLKFEVEKLTNEIRNTLLKPTLDISLHLYDFNFYAFVIRSFHLIEMIIDQLSTNEDVRNAYLKLIRTVRDAVKTRPDDDEEEENDSKTKQNSHDEVTQLLKQKSFIEGIRGREELYKLLTSHEYSIKDTEDFLESISKIQSVTSGKPAKRLINEESQTEMSWVNSLTFKEEFWESNKEFIKDDIFTLLKNTGLDSELLKSQNDQNLKKTEHNENKYAIQIGKIEKKEALTKNTNKKNRKYHNNKYILPEVKQITKRGDERKTTKETSVNSFKNSTKTNQKRELKSEMSLGKVQTELWNNKNENSIKVESEVLELVEENLFDYEEYEFDFDEVKKNKKDKLADKNNHKNPPFFSIQDKLSNRDSNFEELIQDNGTHVEPMQDSNISFIKRNDSSNLEANKLLSTKSKEKVFQRDSDINNETSQIASKFNEKSYPNYPFSTEIRKTSFEISKEERKIGKIMMEEKGKQNLISIERKESLKKHEINVSIPNSPKRENAQNQSSENMSKLSKEIVKKEPDERNHPEVYSVNVNYDFGSQNKINVELKIGSSRTNENEGTLEQRQKKISEKEGASEPENSFQKYKREIKVYENESKEQESDLEKQNSPKTLANQKIKYTDIQLGSKDQKENGPSKNYAKIKTEKSGKNQTISKNKLKLPESAEVLPKISEIVKKEQRFIMKKSNYADKDEPSVLQDILGISFSNKNSSKNSETSGIKNDEKQEEKIRINSPIKLGKLTELQNKVYSFLNKDEIDHQEFKKNENEIIKTIENFTNKYNEIEGDIEVAASSKKFEKRIKECVQFIKVMHTRVCGENCRHLERFNSYLKLDRSNGKKELRLPKFLIDKSILL